MILRAKNEKAVLSFTWRNRIKNISVPKYTVVDVNEETMVVILRNMWSGAHEKWIADSELTRIQLTEHYLKKLLSSPHFKILEKWKPCM
jgi:hypothetical protein